MKIKNYGKIDSEVKMVMAETMLTLHRSYRKVCVYTKVCGYTKGIPWHFETWWWNKEVDVVVCRKRVN